MTDAGDDASVAAAYEQWAQTYDTDHNRTRDLDAAVTRQLLGEVHVQQLVEAGCGTGKNSAFLASITDRLLSFDLTPAMLAVAREKVRTPHVTFAAHDVREPWPVEPASADLITFNLVLEHIEDLEAVLRHAARACRVGGTVLVSELHPYRQYRGSRAQFVGRNGEDVYVAAFPHHVSEYLHAAEAGGLRLDRLSEWWHRDDDRSWPRLLTLQFTKSTQLPSTRHGSPSTAAAPLSVPARRHNR